jgi:hypothetical protein
LDKAAPLEKATLGCPLAALVQHLIRRIAADHMPRRPNCLGRRQGDQSIAASNVENTLTRTQRSTGDDLVPDWGEFLQLSPQQLWVATVAAPAEPRRPWVASSLGDHAPILSRRPKTTTAFQEPYHGAEHRSGSPAPSVATSATACRQI